MSLHQLIYDFDENEDHEKRNLKNILTTIENVGYIQFFIPNEQERNVMDYILWNCHSMSLVFSKNKIITSLIARGAPCNINKIASSLSALFCLRFNLSIYFGTVFSSLHNVIAQSYLNSESASIVISYLGKTYQDCSIYIRTTYRKNGCMCENCYQFISNKIFRCSQCKHSVYCSKFCQRRHWSHHNQECKFIPCLKYIDRK